MRDALSLLDQAIAHGAGKVEEASVREMLGVVDRTLPVQRCSVRSHAANGPALLAEADRMAARSLSFESALQDLATLLHRRGAGADVAGSAAGRRSRRDTLFELADALQRRGCATPLPDRDPRPRATSASRRTSTPASP